MQRYPSHIGPSCVLRLKEVMARVGMGRSWIYEAVTDGAFPPPVKLGSRAVGWRERDVEDWISSRKTIG